jgi:hypothetical protein
MLIACSLISSILLTWWVLHEIAAQAAPTCELRN